ncbi:MAG: glutamine-hydrolyzing GMP synthase [Candidatus Omnitrophica bacterium]|nr:glutamine-hydrolyzing GMP synthase [Candidatus Omnitrophota bacterium]
MNETVVILDFGSQVTQLIARRAREHKVYSVILPYHAPLAEILSHNPKALILSGSPANVYGPKAPIPDKRIFSLGLPLLGICYGLQLIAHILGGKVHKSKKREYGFSQLTVKRPAGLFAGLPKKLNCWMSHGDKLDRLPPGFESIAFTANSPVAAVANDKRRIYGVQFHPEVVHTPQGSKIIGNFLFEICKFHGDWTPKSFIQEAIKKIRRQVGRQRVVLGLSGGVDSSVAGLLLHKALGKQLTCIYVDNGLMRLNETSKIKAVFKDHFHMNIKFVDASRIFLKALKGIIDPEQKRKTIGRVFVETFDREAKKLGKVPYLAQGTLYPDVIESVSVHGGPTSVIKSHHNVGGLPKGMKFKLVEPLRELFKDEVRKVGNVLGLKDELVKRHPFPGPGLGVRILGEVTQERCDILREADWIAIEEIRKAGLYDKIWQAFVVLLPVQSVGVMGDERTYENVAAVRAVTSQDGMTADWAKIPSDVLGRISNRMINEVRGINRVCYDISSKPPATIEWE